MKTVPLLVAGIVAFIAFTVAFFPLLSTSFWKLFKKAEELFLANQFLQTFILGSLGGSIIYGLNYLTQYLWNRFYSLFRSDITIKNTDPVRLDTVQTQYYRNHIVTNPHSINIFELNILIFMCINISIEQNYTAVVDFITDNFLGEDQGARCSMQVTTKHKKKTWKDYRNEWMGTGERKPPDLDIRPNDDGGIHTFHYKGKG